MNSVSVLTPYEQRMLQHIENDPRVKVIAVITGGRVIAEMNPRDFKPHDTLKKMRGDSPDVKLLTASIKVTGNDTLYAISLFVTENESSGVDFWIGDGMQRHRSLIDNAVESTVVQIILRWTTVKDAMADGISANMARYQFTDGDLLSIIRTGVLDTSQLRSLTGKSESTIDRLVVIAPHTWLCDIMATGSINKVDAAKWVSACKGNPDLLAALQATLESRFEEAEESATFYQNEAKKTKMDIAEKKKTAVSYWFKQHDLSGLESALASGDLTTTEVGTVVDLEGGATLRHAIIGPQNEWKTRLALSGFFDRDADEIPIESYDKVISNFDKIRTYIVGHRDRLVKQAGTAAPAVVTASPKPAMQTPTADIDATEEADGDE